jgi:hypothetical protein
MLIEPVEMHLDSEAAVVIEIVEQSCAEAIFERKLLNRNIKTAGI